MLELLKQVSKAKRTANLVWSPLVFSFLTSGDRNWLTLGLMRKLRSFLAENATQNLKSTLTGGNKNNKIQNIHYISLQTTFQHSKLQHYLHNDDFITSQMEVIAQISEHRDLMKLLIKVGLVNTKRDMIYRASDDLPIRADNANSASWSFQS